MGKRFFDSPIAHRGLHDRAAGIIENSRSAFERAIEKGFAIECDLQITRDGVPVVFHDDRLERLTGLSGFVRDISSDVLLKTPLLGSAAGDCPQTFGQLLEQVAGRALLQVELKHQISEKTKPLAAVAAANASRYRGPIVFESFDPWLLTGVREAGFSGQLGIITERYVDEGEDYEWLKPFDRFALRHLLHWPLTRFDFLSVDKEALELPAVRAFRALGKPVTSWTIRSADQAKLALAHADQIVFEGFLPTSA
ncbi:MAG TPA: glycerophosphodiester phosphodiesterase family protein [Devosiaceae bacterium]|nr:glycerophosphodiester phosphodiesterase family protein [Devosiaceae bacterium]